MKNIFMTVIVMTVVVFAHAQVSFKVVDATTNIAVVGAELRDTTSNELIAKSNSKGVLTVPAGIVAAYITHSEYQRITFDESLIKNNILYLWPSVTRLDEVVISASRFEEAKKDVAVPVHVVSSADMSFRQNTSMADVMINTGEVFVQKSQQGGGSPVLRGFETNKMLLVVDGIRMNNAIYRAGHLQNIITVDHAMLDRVEVSYGPGSVMYGSDALGGVIHMYTRNPMVNDTHGVRVDGGAFVRYATANQENTGHFHINVGGRKLASLTSFTYSDFDDLRQGNVRHPAYIEHGKRQWYVERINGIDSMISNYDAVNEDKVNVNTQKGSAYKQYDLLQKILFKQNNRVSHMLNFQYSTSSDVPRYDRLTQTQGGNPRFAEWYYGPQERLLAAYHLLLSNGKKIYDNARVILSYQKIEESRNDRRFKQDWLNHQIEGVNVLALNADFEKAVGKWEIRYGAELARNEVSSVAYRENITTGEEENIATRYPDGGSTMQWGSAYGTVQYELDKIAVLAGGLRFNRASLNSKWEDTTFFNFPFNDVTRKNTSLSGSLGVIITPGAGFSLAVNGSTGYRVPNVDDMGKIFESVAGQIVIPNDKLKPETTTTLDVTLAKTFNKRCMVSVNGFYTWYNNAITTDFGTYQGEDSIMFGGMLSAVTMQVNKAKAYLHGGTARISADITDNVTFMSSLTYTYGRIVTDSTDYPLDHIPPIFGKTSLILNVKKFRSEVYAMYSGWKRLEEYNLIGEDNIAFATPDGTPAWCTLNARLSYQVMKNASVQVALENILDQNYRVFASNISAPGRNLIVTLRANW